MFYINICNYVLYQKTALGNQNSKPSKTEQCKFLFFFQRKKYSWNDTWQMVFMKLNALNPDSSKSFINNLTCKNFHKPEHTITSWNKLDITQKPQTGDCAHITDENKWSCRLQIPQWRRQTGIKQMKTVVWTFGEILGKNIFKPSSMHHIKYPALLLFTRHIHSILQYLYNEDKIPFNILKIFTVL